MGIYFNRSTWNTRTKDKRSCETCRFAELRKVEPMPTNHMRGGTIVRCHRHPPVHNVARPDFYFPQVNPTDKCDEYEAEDGAERDENGAPACMRCNLCAHARELGRVCQKRAPAEVGPDGHAVEVAIGPGQWCGDHKREEGLSVERFEGVLPAFLRELVDKARRKVA